MMARYRQVTHADDLVNSKYPGELQITLMNCK
jgi:hypothetical protein